MRAAVRPPGVGRPMRGGSHELRAGTDDTGGAMSFWLSSTQLGKGPPLHIHEREDELLYIVAGRYQLDCGGVAVEAGAGTLVYLPRKTAHVFRSVSESGPSCLVHCCVPGGIEGYFDAIGDSEATTDEGRELRRAAGARFGMSFPSARDARLDDLYLEPGAEWRFGAADTWRVVHLVAGELGLEAADGARELLATGCTATLPPGWHGELNHRGGERARAFLFAAPRPPEPRQP